jgi:hypothetical protein
MLQAKERASTPCPSVVFSLGLTFESRKELGVRQIQPSLFTSDGEITNKHKNLHVDSIK